MSDDDTAADPAEQVPVSRDTGTTNQQPRHQVATSNAEDTAEVG